MFYKLETKSGNISMEKSVIAKIIVKTVAAFSGKVFISTKTGKIIGVIAKIGGMDEKSHIEINMDGKELKIKMYVVIRFGMSIKSTTDELIKDIKSNIEEMTDIKVSSVSIVVTGMISKHLSKRNIEIRG